jgi:carbamoyl-phosphate synthase small subunit
MKSVLTLSNGIQLEGESLGATIPAAGELVFTTGMVGYSETLTDPSYYGQIIVFTYPMVGNYGIPEQNSDQHPQLGFESRKIHASGVVIHQESEQAFHWNSAKTLHRWLSEQNIPGIRGIDTRYLAQLIRESNGLMATLSSCLLSQVSTKSRQKFGKGKTRIGLIDCGTKWNIIRELLALNCEVELLPWDTDFSTVDCDAWLLSNGPGDPKMTGDLKDRIANLFSQNRPIFGICLGFQLLALASGAETRKLKFGHRGHNHGVVEVGKERAFLTSQNHGFEVVEASLKEGWEPWFRHINDGSLEGFKHESGLFSGVQFHPESAAGPLDTSFLLRDFVERVRAQ